MSRFAYPICLTLALVAAAYTWAPRTTTLVGLRALREGDRIVRAAISALEQTARADSAAPRDTVSGYRAGSTDWSVGTYVSPAPRGPQRPKITSYPSTWPNSPPSTAQTANTEPEAALPATNPPAPAAPPFAMPRPQVEPVQHVQPIEPERMAIPGGNAPLLTPPPTGASMPSMPWQQQPYPAAPAPPHAMGPPSGAYPTSAMLPQPGVGPQQPAPAANIAPPFGGQAPSPQTAVAPAYNGYSATPSMPPPTTTASPPVAAGGSAPQFSNRAGAADLRTDSGPPDRSGPDNGNSIIARVGSEVILSSEVVGPIDVAIGEYLASLPAKDRDSVPKQVIEDQREKAIKTSLQRHIDSKLILADAQKKVPKENWSKIVDRMETDFTENELPAMLKKLDVSTPAEAEAKLREKGSSLERTRRAYVDNRLAAVWLAEQVRQEKEITHAQMLAYYHEHMKDYEYPARARWEQLFVRFSNHPNREAARRAIEEMGNQAMFGGNLAEVAKARSDGSTAKSGGQFDWTNEGSLTSATLNQALFALPTGSLSPILEDERGYYIVRVLEREPAGRTPFTEAQPEIKEQLRKDASKHQMQEYFDRIKRQTPVWTVYGPLEDDDKFVSEMANAKSGGRGKGRRGATDPAAKQPAESASRPAPNGGPGPR